MEARRGFITILRLAVLASDRDMCHVPELAASV